MFLIDRDGDFRVMQDAWIIPSVHPACDMRNTEPSFCPRVAVEYSNSSDDAFVLPAYPPRDWTVLSRCRDVAEVIHVAFVLDSPL